MPIIIVSAIILTALYRAARTPKARTHLYALISILILGLNNFMISMDTTNKTDCGKYFDQDIGCSNILPGWLIPLSLGLLLLASVLSVYILIKFRDTKG